MFLKFFGKKSAKGESVSTDSGGLVHGIDCAMNYCPSCGDEYRDEIELCATCRIPLVSGREKLASVIEMREAHNGRSMEISPEDELVAIRKGSLSDIKYIQNLLEKERVPAILVGDKKSCGKSCCGPELYLQIKRDDLEAVSEILNKDFIKSTALDCHDLKNASAVFDPLAAETCCPACGCRFSPTIGACPECGLCFE